nr:MAG TPA: hypothetical protein [Caudoviricetes sp.]
MASDSALMRKRGCFNHPSKFLLRLTATLPKSRDGSLN